MNRFALEVYYESGDDRELAERARTALLELVTKLAPHVALEALVLRASSIRRGTFNWCGSRRDVPYHEPSRPNSQTLLITSEELGAHGWGWPGRCVVSKQALVLKIAEGGNEADLLIHEWLHTIYGEAINGRTVPYVDHADRFGFEGTPGPDGDLTWHAWYRFVLGG